MGEAGRDLGRHGPRCPGAGGASGQRLPARGLLAAPAPWAQAGRAGFPRAAVHCGQPSALAPPGPPRFSPRRPSKPAGEGAAPMDATRAAPGPPTRQRPLVLRQVEDLVEIAPLGAVDAPGVFVLAQAGGRAGHVAPRGGRLQLPTAPPVSRQRGRGAGTQGRPPHAGRKRSRADSGRVQMWAWAPPRALASARPRIRAPLRLGKKPGCSGAPTLPPPRRPRPAPAAPCAWAGAPRRAAQVGISEPGLAAGQSSRSNVRT